MTALAACRQELRANIVHFQDEPFLFEGLGASVYLHDDQHLKEIDGLRLRYIRIEPSLNWAYYGGKLPEGVGLQEFRKFAARKLEGSRHRYSRRFIRFSRSLRKRDIRVIWVMYQMPFQWLNGKQRNRLRPIHEPDFLNLWMAQLLYYKDKGIIPYAVEMANEPDGWWNGRLNAADYHGLVVKFRRLLNQHGLGRVKIGGPGFSTLNLYHNNREWIARMPDDAFAALDFFTVHGWDEVQYPQAGLNFLRKQWEPFRRAIIARDPGRTRRIIMTEYSTEVTAYGKSVFFSPRTRAVHTAHESPYFALRVVANTILHLNHGTSVPMIWRLSDHVMDKSAWGLIAAKPVPYKRPSFYKLKEMFASLAPATPVHPVRNIRDDHIALLITAPDKRLELRAVNMSVLPKTIRFRSPRSAHGCSCRPVTKASAETSVCRSLQKNMFELTISPRSGILCDLS